jgi:phage internal scaffolding protein
MKDVLKEAPFFRTPYNYDRDFASDASALHCEDPTMTMQQFAEESDINTIVRRFGIGVEMPQNFKMPSYGDFTDAVTDFHTAANMVIEADNAFMTLPANIRARFYNDPQNLLEFLADEGNLDEARRLGLVNPAPIVEPPASDPGTVAT